MNHVRTATCRCGQLTATVTGDPAFPQPQYSVWEQRKHEWVAIVGDAVEHFD